MDENESIKLWISFLQHRLSFYENSFNFIMTTTLAMMGLIGALISFGVESFYEKLTVAIIFVIGILIVYTMGNKILSRVTRRKKEIHYLIQDVISGKISAPKDIEKHWLEIVPDDRKK